MKTPCTFISKKTSTNISIAISATIAAAIMASSAVLAGQTSDNAAFKQLDKNSDGYISIEEAAANAALVKSWKKFDKDINEKLEMSEFSAFEEEQTFVPPENSDAPGIGAEPHN